MGKGKKPTLMPMLCTPATPEAHRESRRKSNILLRKALKQAYRHVFMSGLNVSQGVEKARAEGEPIPEVLHFLDFIKNSERGITIG